MPSTAAEKQRRYRQRIRKNSSKYEEYLEKERARWENRKQRGKLKQIGDLNSRDYLNQHMVVTYDGKPYPGQVIDVDEQQGHLHVSCMHRVGTTNRFFGPSAPTFAGITLMILLLL